VANSEVYKTAGVGFAPDGHHFLVWRPTSQFDTTVGEASWIDAYAQANTEPLAPDLPAHSSVPAFSRDGKLIAFWHAEGTIRTAPHALYVAKADGTGAVRIGTKADPFASLPVWLP
jgi:hypothetical protein